MSRQALGAAKKDVVTSVRLSRREREVLTQKYGSPSNALRGFVNKVMNQHEKEYAERLKRLDR